MILFTLFAAFYQSPAEPVREKPTINISSDCRTRDNIINANLLVNCLPGLEVIGLGTLREAEPQEDGTFLHRVPFRAIHGITLDTMICGIDLINFSFSSATGAVLNLSESVNEAEYCRTKRFVVPAGEVELALRTRTRHPALVVRSSVSPTPVATLLESPSGFVILPPTILLLPPPPPPPPGPPPGPPPAPSPPPPPAPF